MLLRVKRTFGAWSRPHRAFEKGTVALDLTSFWSAQYLGSLIRFSAVWHGHVIMVVNETIDWLIIV